MDRHNAIVTKQQREFLCIPQQVPLEAQHRVVSTLQRPGHRTLTQGRCSSPLIVKVRLLASVLCGCRRDTEIISAGTNPFPTRQAMQQNTHCVFPGRCSSTPQQSLPSPLSIPVDLGPFTRGICFKKTQPSRITL